MHLSPFGDGRGRRRSVTSVPIWEARVATIRQYPGFRFLRPGGLRTLLMTTHPAHRKLIPLLLIAALASGCEVETYEDAAGAFQADAPPPPDPVPDPDPDPDPTPPPAGFDPNFSEIQANVFTPSCATSGCHDAAAAASLELSEDASYAMLVDIPSSQDGNILRVRPNNPDASYLIQKLEGTAATGQRMPPGGAVPQNEIDVIRQWIIDGAIDDTATQSATAIRVSSISPRPSAALAAAPTQLIVGFSRELDATSVHGMTFVLEASGGDGDFANGNETRIPAASIRVPDHNRRSVIFDLSGADLADDHDRITLAGDGASIVREIDANAVDGEFAGELPSGDGTSGGTFRSTFSVAIQGDPRPDAR